jgi:hypothetical protein
MWFFTKCFSGPSALRRRVRRMVSGDLESLESRRLLSVAMPAAEIHRVPPNAVDASDNVASSSPDPATVASFASVSPGIGANLAGAAMIVASADPTGDPGGDDGDIPPVIGKVSW